MIIKANLLRGGAKFYLKKLTKKERKKKKESTKTHRSNAFVTENPKDSFTGKAKHTGKKSICRQKKKENKITVGFCEEGTKNEREKKAENKERNVPVG